MGSLFSARCLIAEIVASPLLRHHAAIHIRSADASLTPLDNVSLRLLAQHAHNLQSLWCKLTLTLNDPRILPAKLTSLEIQLDATFSDAAVNDVLTAVSALPSLSRLGLRAAALDQESLVDFRLIAACPSLTNLIQCNSGGCTPSLTDTQMDQIRESLGHLQRLGVMMVTADVARFLRPPINARWQELGLVLGDARTGELLLRLPTLTKLELSYDESPSSVDFLPELPFLTMLDLGCSDAIPTDVVLASLRQCIGITELNLGIDFTSAGWSVLFAKLTIKKLRLFVCGKIGSLQCFAAGPITHSLEQLSMCDITLPPSELSHLYALGRLQTLDLHCCFHPRLDEATIDTLLPPTPLFPALVKFTHAWRNSDGVADSRKRQGSSFEWMQLRLTQ